MVECKVSIIEVFDLDQFPGWCKVILTDANGVDHAFDDKLSVFGLEEVEVVEVVRDLGNSVEIDTSVPHGLEAEDGNSRFVVRKDLIKFF